MREITITKKLYTFEELSPEIQQKVIERNWDWNVDQDWWEFAYDEIAELWKKRGLGTDDHKKGNGPFYFDLDRGSYFYATGVYVEDYEKFIKALHIDPSSELAEGIRNNVSFIIQHYGLGNAKTLVSSEYISEDAEDLIQKFIDALCEDSLDYLQKEYDYLTSDEAIRESIISNESEFDEKGNPA